MRVIVSILLVFLIVFGAFSTASCGDKPYRVASYYIPLLVEDSERGSFMLLLREAARRAGIEYEIVMAPPKRAMRYYEDGEVIAIIPALLATLVKDSALTRPIFRKQIHAIVPQGAVIPESIEALEGLRVGLTRGYSFPRSLTMNEKITIDWADTTDASLKKLQDGRLDVVVADGHTAVSAISKMGLTGFNYDLSRILHEQVAYIACQPTEEGRELARKLTVALDSMETDGTMALILPHVAGSETQ